MLEQDLISMAWQKLFARYRITIIRTHFNLMLDEHIYGLCYLNLIAMFSMLPCQYVFDL